MVRAKMMMVVCQWGVTVVETTTGMANNNAINHNNPYLATTLAIPSPVFPHVLVTVMSDFWLTI
jgi:hypothetical protein